ncbi:uncharacterized protein LOC128555320 [Mercenaria mercenaria]|uniref:uncharacterized protein LOC128555320 n=1 Tax=Mercenaria mercenaria TaxID=6596 RepID=UPI00234F790F|nr:uncharacterized protein LOC128555320 [Mercenaria mercenaria]
MEEFYNEVIENVCLDFGNEEVQDITNGLELLINRFVKAMTVKFSEFKVERVTRCGSMAEKTRIKGFNGLEYDYLLEMNTWPNCGELQFRRSCEGSMQPLYKVSENHSVPLKTSVLPAFRYNLCKLIDKRCKRSFCPRLSNSNQNEFKVYQSPSYTARNEYIIAEGCQNCSVYMNTGSLRFDAFSGKLKFVWATKYRKDNYNYNYYNDPPFKIKNCYSDNINEISVDIHPVLIVNPDRILTDHSEKTERSSTTGVCCYLFPNSTSNHNSQHCHGGGGCWRISYYNTEVNALQDTSQVHRDMFMILKFITEQFFSEGYIGRQRDTLGQAYKVRSYEIKTAVLHHIKNCALAEPDIGQCLLDTMELLSIYFKEENLQNVVSTFNIFKTCTSTTDREQNTLWYQIIGHTFHALGKLCTTGIHSGTVGWLKDLRLVYVEIVRALWMSNNPELTHSLNLTGIDLQIDLQACVEALNNFVDERTWRTADSFIKEYALKQFRIERLQRLHKRFDESVLNEELKFIYIHRDQQLKKECGAFRKSQLRMLTGCFI